MVYWLSRQVTWPIDHAIGIMVSAYSVHSRDDVVSVGNVWGDAQDGDDGVRAISNGEPKLTS